MNINLKTGEFFYKMTLFWNDFLEKNPDIFFLFYFPTDSKKFYHFTLEKKSDILFKFDKSSHIDNVFQNITNRYISLKKDRFTYEEENQDTKRISSKVQNDKITDFFNEIKINITKIEDVNRITIQEDWIIFLFFLFFEAINQKNKESSDNILYNIEENTIKEILKKIEQIKTNEFKKEDMEKIFQDIKEKNKEFFEKNNNKFKIFIFFFVVLLFLIIYKIKFIK